MTVTTCFPIPTQTTFGLHRLALQCGDGQTPDYLRNKFTEYRRWGVQHIKLITSPGGGESRG